MTSSGRRSHSLIFRDTGHGLVAAVAFTIVSCEVAPRDGESLEPEELNSSLLFRFYGRSVLRLS